MRWKWWDRKWILYFTLMNYEGIDSAISYFHKPRPDFTPLLLDFALLLIKADRFPAITGRFFCFPWVNSKVKLPPKKNLEPDLTPDISKQPRREIFSTHFGTKAVESEFLFAMCVSWVTLFMVILISICFFLFFVQKYVVRLYATYYMRNLDSA